MRDDNSRKRAFCLSELKDHCKIRGKGGDKKHRLQENGIKEEKGGPN